MLPECFKSNLWGSILSQNSASYGVSVFLSKSTDFESLLYTLDTGNILLQLASRLYDFKWEKF